MVGRDPNPGDPGPYKDMRDSTQYHSRLVRGQIQSATESEGKATIATFEIIGQRKVTVPPLWFSAAGRKSAWARYMPLGGEIVNVAYRNDDTAQIVGYDATASNQKDVAGWSVLKGFEEAGDVAGFADFKELKGGEFDLRSSGNAYIFGSNVGTLLLSGGQAFIKLDKQAYRIESKAAETHFFAEASQTRFGTVYRKELPTDAAESAISSGAYKEFLVELKDNNTDIQSKVKIHFGDILDSTNIQETNPDTNQNLRARISIGDPSNTSEVFKLEIDQLGNVVWNQDSNAVEGAKFSAFQFIIDAQSGGKGGIIKLSNTHIHMGGEDANNPAVLWDPGLAQELSGIKTDLANLANDLLRHKHPLPVQSLGIPTGSFIQTSQVTFAPNPPPGEGFIIVDAGPGTSTLAGQTCLSNSGPQEIVTDDPPSDEFNNASLVTPRELGGLFRSEYEPGNPFSTIVNIKE
jgi:hypothetical protein